MNRDRIRSIWARAEIAALVLGWMCACVLVSTPAWLFPSQVVVGVTVLAIQAFGVASGWLVYRAAAERWRKRPGAEDETDEEYGDGE